MPEFFGKFPLVPYSINKTNKGIQVFDLATNILVRVRVLTEKLDQVFHYYEYTIKDGETPEILAEKVYNDPEAHWLILMTNNRTDPYYDWPLTTERFNSYITEKYGSIAYAQVTPHHYETVRETYDVTAQQTTIMRSEIEQNPISNVIVVSPGTGYTNGYMNVASDYGYGGNVSFTVDANGSINTVTINNGGLYIASPNLAVLGANTAPANVQSFVATGNLWSSLPVDKGSYISQTVNGFVINSYPVYRNMVSIYDWEFAQNEAKRQIKLIKPEYYDGIKAEFQTIMLAAQSNPVVPGIRTVS